MKNKPTLGRLRTLVRISAVFILAHSAFALAQHTYPDLSEEHNEGHKNCSNRTLLGDYGIQLEGTILGPNLPLRTLVLARFNGEGLVTEVDHVVLDGQPPAEEWRPTTGAYSVNPDCTGSASVEVAPGNPPLNYHFVVVKQGREILIVVDGGAIRGVAYKVE